MAGGEIGRSLIGDGYITTTGLATRKVAGRGVAYDRYYCSPPRSTKMKLHRSSGSTEGGGAGRWMARWTAWLR